VLELERQLAQAKVDQILSARERMRPFEESASKLEDEQRLLTTLKLTLRQREIDFQVPKRTIEILNTAEAPQIPSKPSWTLNLVFAAVSIFSAGPGEGKSTALRQLALAMAHAGERVLLVDSDVRRPTQHKLAQIEREPGLTDVLQDRAQWRDAVRRDARVTLDVLPAGAPSITISLLYANKLRALVAEFKSSYDKILFDSPPIIGVSDASVLASITDGSVLLIQHRRNPSSMVQRAKQITDGLPARVIGVILNQVPARGGDDYGYYTQNYSYYSHESGVKSGLPAELPPGERPPERLDLEKRGRG
jgi:capsular exopolysaccharide synthesis family protein